MELGQVIPLTVTIGHRERLLQYAQSLLGPARLPQSFGEQTQKVGA